jgi:hypothetical protein
MTEQEWLACTDPQPMLEFLRGTASDRKLRLFACACCRRLWHLLTDERSRNAVEVAEQFADGRKTTDEISARFHDAEPVKYDFHHNYFAADAASRCLHRSHGLVPKSIQWAVTSAAPEDGKATAATAETTEQTGLVRCIFGNPFRPVTINPSWLTSTVIQLAEAIYHERAFERLPILADALEDAGCSSAEILAHCRQGGEHCRGCWVVDLVLGKE